jgi:hypothetical protein
MNIREISDVFKDTANQITALKSYNFGWPSDRTRSTNTEDYQELNEFPRVFFSVPTITGSDQTRKQDTYQVTIFFDDLLGYDNNGDADLTLQLDKWAALQEYANYFVQRLNKVKQSILPNYLFIPEAPSITFDSFTGLQRMITVQLSFTLVVPTNCEPIVSTLIECIANIITSSNLTASITKIIKLVSSLQASSSLSASVLVSKLAESNLNTESSLSANIQIAKLASSSLNAGATLSADALITRLFEASLNGNGSLFANALVTKLAASSLTGAGTLAAELTVGVAFDADAQAFFDRVTTAGGTLTTTEQNAVNTLVVGMKADGIWTKMKAIYPMVGASAAACAQNLKSSSFTGTFSSGWTFASTGVKGNGTSAFMNTGLLLSTQLTNNNTHISFYSRTNIIQAAQDLGYIALTVRLSMELNFSGFGFAADQYNTSTGRVSVANTNTQGFYISSRTNSTTHKAFKNNAQFGSTNTGVSGDFNALNFNLYIGAVNTDSGVARNYSSKEVAFSSIGDGLTDTNAANFYTRVQAFQTTLNRQINP